VSGCISNTVATTTVRSEIPLPLSCLDRHSEGAVPVARVGEVFSKVTHWGATALFLAGVEGSSHHGIEKVCLVVSSSRSVMARSVMPASYCAVALVAVRALL
jgi:hypothetical protein